MDGGATTRRVTAIVVTYRSADTIDAALSGLRDAHECGLLDAVVVDNQSGDGTVERVRERHPWVELVENERNVGFGRACNAGFQRARTEYVLLLNPDAAIGREALEVLVSFLDAHPRAGIAAPATRTDEGGLQFAGGLTTPAGILRQAAGFARPYPARAPIKPGAAPYRIDWACGAVLLLRKSMVEDLRGFDPRFFLYFEETDLCRRALDESWEIWAVGGAVAEHQVGRSAQKAQEWLYAGDVAAHFFRSRFYYLCKHHGRAAAAGAEIAELCILGALALPRWLLHGTSGGFWPRMRSPILTLPEEAT